MFKTIRSLRLGAAACVALQASAVLAAPLLASPALAGNVPDAGFNVSSGRAKTSLTSGPSGGTGPTRQTAVPLAALLPACRSTHAAARHVPGVRARWRRVGKGNGCHWPENVC